MAPSLACAPSSRAAELVLEPVAEGLRQPVDLTAPPGDPRLFVVEQGGTIRVIRAGRVGQRPFLDLSALVSSGGERGLLGLAFHPDYRRNGRFYVNYTDRRGDTRVVRYRVRADDPDRADPASAALVLHVTQPYSNHNGGQIVFGPDRMLWIGLGDGGSGGDPHGNGQSPRALLGKMLRIDVDAATPYAIPADNPYRGSTTTRPEIWAFGLRNPWRFSFDPPSGMLFIGDVGQNRIEEIDAAPWRTPGLNYGWNVKEGSRCYEREPCAFPGLTEPVLDYPHAEGQSVTGGFVYRGRRIPALQGVYLYADYQAGWVAGFTLRDGVAANRVRYRTPGGLNPSSFGRDAAGEVYLVDHGGRVFRVAGVR